MSRYRKVDPRIWNDAKFRALSKDGKLVFFMLLTHPNMTALGAMRASLAGLAEELGWESEAFRKAFADVLSKGMAEHDAMACMVALPNFIRYNPPESPNVIKAWTGALDLLPECALKNGVLHRAKDFADSMSEGFGKAFMEAFSKAMPNQEQEQEQEQEQKNPPPASRVPRAGKPPKVKGSKRCPVDFVVTSEMRAKAEEVNPGVDIDRETVKFRDHEFKTTRSDWPATWRNWMCTAFERLPRPAKGGALSFREREAQASAARVAEFSPAAAAKPARHQPDYIDAEFKLVS